MYEQPERPQDETADSTSEEASNGTSEVDEASEESFPASDPPAY